MSPIYLLFFQMKFSLTKALKGLAFFVFAGAFLPMIGYGLDDCSTLTGYNIPTTECDILVEFYNATDGSGWNDDTNRLTDSDACNWAGIDCTDVMGQDHVSNI